MVTQARDRPSAARCSTTAPAQKYGSHTRSSESGLPRRDAMRRRNGPMSRKASALVSQWSPSSQVNGSCAMSNADDRAATLSVATVVLF